MPLDCVYPALQVEPVLDGIPVIRVTDGGIYIIRDVVIADCLIENLVTMLCK